MIRNKCCWGCIWWTDRNSKNCPLKKIKDQKLHFDEGPKINLPLQIKKQMCKFSKYRCGIFYPEFGIWWIRYLSVIWSTIPLYREKISITDYKMELFCFKIKININYKGHLMRNHQEYPVKKCWDWNSLVLVWDIFVLDHSQFWSVPDAKIPDIGTQDKMSHVSGIPGLSVI